MELTDRDKEIIKDLIDRGEPLPAKYKLMLFADAPETYRTRKDRKLELTGGNHSYSQPGRYKIAVKVIDIFGNDTTNVVEVKV